MDTPFNEIIAGATCAGKTYYLLQMLETEYYKHFENIVLLCPTFPYNTTYTNWKYIMDPKLYAIPVPHDRVDDTLGFVMEHFKGTNTLVILDDCAATRDLKKRTSQLVSAAFSARHYGISTIVLTQQLTSIALPYRQNIAKIVTFHNPSKKDQKAITDDYLNGVSNDKVTEITEKLRKNKYARLEINLRHPYGFCVVVP